MLSSKEQKILKGGGILLLAGLGTALFFLFKVGVNVGYAPEQPIPFSHKIHAEDNQIPCMYCHANADKSKHATVPGLSVCMNCHSVVKTDSPLIKQVHENYKNDTAIEWIKVHDVPDFVMFNHKRHIAKGIDCAACHGDVQSMDKITQVKTLDMGFCINCHRDNQAPTDCYTCHH